MNILLTNQCNRRCAYCFAQERVSFTATQATPQPAPPIISRANFARAISFARRSRLPVVGILGGEPSLHPQMTDLLADAWLAGVRTKVFTNGMWRDDQIEAIGRCNAAALRNLDIVVNVNEPSRTPPHEERAQRELFERLGRNCSLSFNVSRPEFESAFLVDLIEKYSLRRSIRVGVAQPLAQMPNEHVDIADYHTMAPAVLRLALRCDSRDIRLGFDCGFTLCMFTTEQLGQLMLAGARVRSSCGPALDVGTDLSVWACFPLSTFTKGVSLNDFDDARQLSRFFRQEFEPLFSAGALDKCIDCRHRRRRQCTGGCAAHVYRRLNP